MGYCVLWKSLSFLAFGLDKERRTIVIFANLRFFAGFFRHNSLCVLGEPWVPDVLTLTVKTSYVLWQYREGESAKTLTGFSLQFVLCTNCRDKCAGTKVPQHLASHEAGHREVAGRKKRIKGQDPTGSSWGSYEVIRRSSDRMSNIMESLILAQNERWRRVLSMQVERQPGQLSSQQSKKSITQRHEDTKGRKN